MNLTKKVNSNPRPQLQALTPDQLKFLERKVVTDVPWLNEKSGEWWISLREVISKSVKT